LEARSSVENLWKRFSKSVFLKGFFEFSTTAKKFSIGFPQSFPQKKQGFPQAKFDSFSLMRKMNRY